MLSLVGVACMFAGLCFAGFCCLDFTRVLVRFVLSLSLSLRVHMRLVTGLLAASRRV